MGPKSDIVAGGGKSFMFVVEGKVLCLTIVGNRAAIGGELTHFEAEGWNTELYHGWYFFVEDNGNQQGVPDKISYQFPTLNPVTTCPPDSRHRVLRDARRQHRRRQGRLSPPVEAGGGRAPASSRAPSRDAV